MALGLLQSTGEIRRVPVNGRLDQQRYGYVRWTDSPSRTTTFTPEEARTELARLYFGWTGPASLAHFRWFSAFGVQAAKAAVAPLGLLPVDGTDLLIRPEDAAEFAAFVPPSGPGYALVTWIDGVVLLRRDLAALLDPSAGGISVLGSALRGLGDVRGMSLDSPAARRPRLAALRALAG